MRGKVFGTMQPDLALLPVRLLSARNDAALPLVTARRIRYPLRHGTDAIVWPVGMAGDRGRTRLLAIRRRDHARRPTGWLVWRHRGGIGRRTSPRGGTRNQFLRHLRSVWLGTERTTRR